MWEATFVFHPAYGCFIAVLFNTALCFYLFACVLLFLLCDTGVA